MANDGADVTCRGRAFQIFIIVNSGDLTMHTACYLQINNPVVVS